MSNLLNRQRASDAAPDLQGLSRTQARDQVIEQFMEGELSRKPPTIPLLRWFPAMW